MAYDHSRKAGNRDDVWKHAVLVALMDAITADSDSFRYVESHAGAPFHDLQPGGEWRHAAGRSPVPAGLRADPATWPLPENG